MKHNTQFFVEYFALDLLMNSDGETPVFSVLSIWYFNYTYVCSLQSSFRASASFEDLP